MNAIAYLRVSTADQADSGLGMEAQRAAITKHAEREGWTIAAWHSDEGISGSAGIEDRPGLALALDALGRGDVLVVAKLDRIARDALLAAWVDKECQRRGARLASCAGEGTADDEPASKLLRQIVAAFAEFERAMIRARTKAAARAAKTSGRRWGTIPFGFTVADGRLVEHPGEQQALQVMLTTPGGPRSVARALQERGLLNRKGRPFSPMTVLRLRRSHQR